MKNYRMTLKIWTVLLVLAGVVGQPAYATLQVIDFEDLGLAPGDRIDPPDYVPIISGGFSFAPTSNSHLYDVHAGNSMNSWTFNGTTVLVGHDEILMTKVDGGTFSLINFDLAGWPDNDEVPFSVIANTGTTAHFIPDGLVDGSGGVVDFETFVLPIGFSNITSVMFVHTGPGTNSGLFALDDIAIPEPATVALLGLGSLLLRRRR